MFSGGSSDIDISCAAGNYYAQFDNLMAIIGKYNNEITAVQLMKSYCMSSLIYGCEIWSLTKTLLIH